MSAAFVTIVGRLGATLQGRWRRRSWPRRAPDRATVPAVPTCGAALRADRASPNGSDRCSRTATPASAGSLHRRASSDPLGSGKTTLLRLEGWGSLRLHRHRDVRPGVPDGLRGPRSRASLSLPVFRGRGGVIGGQRFWLPASRPAARGPGGGAPPCSTARIGGLAPDTSRALRGPAAAGCSCARACWVKRGSRRSLEPKSGGGRRFRYAPQWLAHSSASCSRRGLAVCCRPRPVTASPPTARRRVPEAGGVTGVGSPREVLTPAVLRRRTARHGGARARRDARRGRPAEPPRPPPAPVMMDVLVEPLRYASSATRSSCAPSPVR
jgi:hypothetical protein